MFGRRALRFFVPLAQRAIALREETKSIGVMCSYQMREGFRALGRRMVEGGVLPDPDLVFYMSFHEVRQVLRTRSPVIIQK